MKVKKGEDNYMIQEAGCPEPQLQCQRIGNGPSLSAPQSQCQSSNSFPVCYEVRCYARMYNNHVAEQAFLDEVKNV